MTRSFSRSNTTSSPGAWPANYDECVLVLNKNGGISDYTLYALGILDPDELNDLLMDALASEDLDVPDTNVEFTQDEALALTFKVVNECDMYTKGVFRDRHGSIAVMTRAI